MPEDRDVEAGDNLEYVAPNAQQYYRAAVDHETGLINKAGDAIADLMGTDSTNEQHKMAQEQEHLATHPEAGKTLFSSSNWSPSQGQQPEPDEIVQPSPDDIS